MTTDTRTRAGPEAGERQPRAESPLPTQHATAGQGAEKPEPLVEEGVSRPPFPTRGDVDTEC